METAGTLIKFDYYIFLDYSEYLVGYSIFERNKIEVILSLIKKLKHYRDVKCKPAYLASIKRIIDRKELADNIYKTKIMHMRQNLIIFTEVIEFLKVHPHSAVFVSIDDNQYISFQRLICLMELHALIIKESELKKDSAEYKLSLVIDNMLNLKRMSKKTRQSY